MWPLRKSCLAAFVLVVLSFTSSSGQSSAPSPLPRESYEIIGEVLKHDAREMDLQWISIVRFTHRPGRIDCITNYARALEWQSAVGDLKAKNASIFLIERKFDLPFRYELADEMKPVGYMLEPPPGMSRDEFANQAREEFRKRDEEGYTQVQFSVPGISTDGNMAIVYSAVSCAGTYNILYKRDNRWVVDTEPVCGWIS